jgi:hypothetical protein
VGFFVLSHNSSGRIWAAKEKDETKANGLPFLEAARLRANHRRWMMSVLR